MTNYKVTERVELFLVMLLLLLFGVMTFLLVSSASRTYWRINEEKNHLSDIRIAVSYIDNRIRQSDESGHIELKNNPINGQMAIVIREHHAQEHFETWIYQNEGSLKEAYFKSGIPLSDDLSFEICKIDEFSVKQKNGLLHIQVGRKKAELMEQSKLLIAIGSQG